MADEGEHGVVDEAAGTQDTRVRPGGGLRLVTPNTWGMRGDWAARLPVFQGGFLALDADILTLQETVLTETVDQAAEMLGPGTPWSSNVIGRRTGRASPPRAGGRSARCTSSTCT